MNVQRVYFLFLCSEPADELEMDPPTAAVALSKTRSVPPVK